jgi:hypothetical protein
MEEGDQVAAASVIPYDPEAVVGQNDLPLQ